MESFTDFIEPCYHPQHCKIKPGQFCPGCRCQKPTKKDLREYNNDKAMKMLEEKPFTVLILSLTPYVIIITLAYWATYNLSHNINCL